MKIIPLGERAIQIRLQEHATELYALALDLYYYEQLTWLEALDVAIFEMIDLDLYAASWDRMCFLAGNDAACPF